MPTHCFNERPLDHSSLRALSCEGLTLTLLIARWYELADLTRRLRQTGYAGVYILSGTIADELTVYVGEGAALWKRLGQHRGEPTLQFVREIHLLCCPAFDKASVIYLQEKLTDLVDATPGIRRIGHRPERLNLPEFRKRVLRQQFELGLDYLALSGFSAFLPLPPERLPAEAVPSRPAQ